MKKRYKRNAYFLDEDIFIKGYTDKRGFHPDKGIPCGFELQKFNRHDIGKTIYYTQAIGIDVGLYCVKIIGSNWTSIIRADQVDVEEQIEKELRRLLDKKKAIQIEYIEESQGMVERTLSRLNDYTIVERRPLKKEFRVYPFLF